MLIESAKVEIIEEVTTLVRGEILALFNNNHSRANSCQNFKKIDSMEKFEAFEEQLKITEFKNNLVNL